LDFTREELIDIRYRAKKHSETNGLNPDWKRAYEQLAIAADHLDAMIARCIICDMSDRLKKAIGEITPYFLEEYI